MKNQLDNVNASTRQVVRAALLLALIVAPHSLNIHHTTLLAFTFIVAWKLFSQWHRWMAHRWLAVVLAIIGFSISIWQYGPPIGRDPGVSFLIILLALKMLESRTRRDVRMVLLLGYFIVITHFLYFNGLPMVAFLFVMVFALTWSMIQSGHVAARPHIKSDIRLAAKLLVQAIPFALLLFFLFPRFSGALWLLQSRSDQGTTGMSETLTMGAIADLVESDEIAFTATFPDQLVPPASARYWRGAVLWDTDGRKWIKGPPTHAFNQPVRINLINTGDSYQHEIALQPNDKNWLFALDIPVSQPPGSILSPELYLYQNSPSRSPASYTITSSSQYLNKTINPAQRRRGVNLAPDTLTPRLAQFVSTQVAASTINQKFDPIRYALGILTYFNQNPFVYSLRPPRLLSDSPVDEFMFSTKTGFCEHYASSFVTLMRAANIPARIVLGYLGGEHNPIASQIVVRQSDAHAWAEFWSEERGWIRADPTAAIAPERIENPIDYSLSTGSAGAVIFDSGETAFFGKLLQQTRWYSAYAAQQWQRWFVGFDYRRQQSLLKNIGLDTFNPQALVALAFLAGLVILTGSAFLFYRGDQNRQDPATRLYARYCKKLEKQGVTRKQAEGPVDFYTRCAALFPREKSKLQTITGLYVRLRYGCEQDMNGVKQLKHQIRALRLP